MKEFRKVLSKRLWISITALAVLLFAFVWLMYPNEQVTLGWKDYNAPINVDYQYARLILCSILLLFSALAIFVIVRTIGAIYGLSSRNGLVQVYTKDNDERLKLLRSKSCIATYKVAIVAAVIAAYIFAYLQYEIVAITLLATIAGMIILYLIFRLIYKIVG